MGSECGVEMPSRSRRRAPARPAAPAARQTPHPASSWACPGRVVSFIIPQHDAAAAGQRTGLHQMVEHAVHAVGRFPTSSRNTILSFPSRKAYRPPMQRAKGCRPSASPQALPGATVFLSALSQLGSSPHTSPKSALSSQESVYSSSPSYHSVEGMGRIIRKPCRSARSASDGET